MLSKSIIKPSTYDTSVQRNENANEISSLDPELEFRPRSAHELLVILLKFRGDRRRHKTEFSRETKN